jgi:hypothetical protein
MPPYDVFISYRRKTWPFTHRLAEHIQQVTGWEVFVDLTGVDESRFEDSILKHLRTARCFLLVVSPETFDPDRIHQDGDWVRREIREALVTDRQIVLAMVEGLAPPPPDDLPEDIRDICERQGIKFYPDYFDEGIKKLTDFISTITGLPIAPPEEASSGDVSVSIGGDVSGSVTVAGGDVITTEKRDPDEEDS